MSSNNIATIAFLGNIDYDTRCYNLFNSLEQKGYDVNFIGFDWMTENFRTQKGKKTIYKLYKEFSSLFFYFSFIYKLKWKLFRSNASVFFAEDIYTLPFVVIFAKMKKAKVFYDSRELYGHLAGLKDKKIIQRMLSWIEKKFIAKVDYIIVTGTMDAEYILDEYGLDNTIVLRNLPVYRKPKKIIDLKEKLYIRADKKILLYQGVILQGRGLQPIFNALKKLPNCVLVILGHGEYEDYFKDMADEMNLHSQVFFLGKVNQNELINYTAAADVGLSLIENISLSYHYALPNKLFEYIMAEVPVIVSKLPQMMEIVVEYSVGEVIDLDNQDELIYKINSFIEEEELYANYKTNCVSASKFLHWDNEVDLLFNVLDNLN
jgi:glycosyltransferase involved in cell wall biosynthesis